MFRKYIACIGDFDRRENEGKRSQQKNVFPNLRKIKFQQRLPEYGQPYFMARYRVGIYLAAALYALAFLASDSMFSVFL